jgi:4-amino-4-deoxy-L-arabinose transferase-like glycosyltransferase
MVIFSKLKASIQKHPYRWGVILLMIAAFGVRAWNFSDTLYFQLDQARDARMIGEVLKDGPGRLPLLGPRAAGTYLRLGPIFYYMQYVSAAIFQSAEPHILAYPDLILSVMAIGLFYFFLRQFFTKPISFITTGLFAFSFMLTQYGRFAWNPNQLVLWLLLFFTGIYRAAVDKNPRRRGWWLLAAALAYAIASQLHFTALLVMPVAALGFWIFYRPVKIKWYFWVGALATLFFFYIPVFLSEIHTEWDNWNQFTYALTHKSEEHPLRAKIAKSLDLHGQYYSLMLTSYGDDDYLIFRYGFLLGLIFIIWLGWKFFRAEEKRSKRAFLFLVLIWMVAFGAFYTKMAFTVLKPRFWLMVAPVAFTCLALVFATIYRPGSKKRGRWIMGGIASLLLIANLYAIGYWYWTLENQRELSGGFYARRLMLKQDDLVGMEQMRKVTDIMAKRAKEEGKEACFYAPGEYLRPYEDLGKLYHPEVVFDRISFRKDLNQDCVFFSVGKLKNKERPRLPGDHEQSFEGVKLYEIGQIALWETRRTDISYVKEDILEEVISNEEKLNQVLEKKEVVEKEQARIEEQERQAKLRELREAGEENRKPENDPEPNRERRVFWYHVFDGSYEKKND